MKRKILGWIMHCAGWVLSVAFLIKLDSVYAWYLACSITAMIVGIFLKNEGDDE